MLFPNINSKMLSAIVPICFTSPPSTLYSQHALHHMSITLWNGTHAWSIQIRQWWKAVIKATRLRCFMRETPVQLTMMAATSTMPCKFKRPYLLTWKVSRYSLLALHGSTEVMHFWLPSYGFCDLESGSHAHGFGPFWPLIALVDLPRKAKMQ